MAIRRSHMDCLIRMNKVTQKNDIASLRKLFNGIENCTRNLSALKLDISAYGSLLIPLLKNKLPDEMNMTIARRFRSDIWTLERLMTFLNDELTAYENCKPVVKSSSEGNRRKGRLDTFTANCLHGQTEQKRTRSCLFCSGSDHLASRCKSVTNVATRKDLLRKQGRCIVCLGTGHLGRATKFVRNVRRNIISPFARVKSRMIHIITTLYHLATAFCCKLQQQRFQIVYVQIKDPQESFSIVAVKRATYHRICGTV